MGPLGCPRVVNDGIIFGTSREFHFFCKRFRGPTDRLSSTYSLHCSSSLGLPFRILYTKLVKPKNGTRMETIGSTSACLRFLKQDPCLEQGYQQTSTALSHPSP